MSFVLFKEFFEIRIFALTFALYFSLLFNCQGPMFRRVFRDSLIIISQRLSFVNRFFKSFLDFFQLFSTDFKDPRYLSVALATLNILPLFPRFVKCEFRQSVYLLYARFVYGAQRGEHYEVKEALGCPRALLGVYCCGIRCANRSPSF